MPAVRRVAIPAVGLGLALLAAAFTRPPHQPAPSVFALLFTTGPGWDSSRPPAQQAHFGAHSANLSRLRQAGIIVAGGRFGAYGLILVRAPGRDSVNALLRPDSSLVAGTFKVEVAPWSTVYEGTITR
ncbi:MAG TPA: hypothetical protein VLE53_17880 [Gemmatimonadaceae bacterium]|nr:hypothetical protein [Gemmatimonadaceae bacterium]